MHITAQCLQNDLYCVEWDIKLYYAIAFTMRRGGTFMVQVNSDHPFIT